MANGKRQWLETKVRPVGHEDERLAGVPSIRPPAVAKISDAERLLAAAVVFSAVRLVSLSNEENARLAVAVVKELEAQLEAP